MTKLLHYDDLRPLGVALSKSQLARLEKAGRFPKRVRLSGHRYAYVASEVEGYIQAIIAERDGVADAA
jgi:prophage regulatory protein